MCPQSSIRTWQARPTKSSTRRAPPRVARSSRSISTSPIRSSSTLARPPGSSCSGCHTCTARATLLQWSINSWGSLLIGTSMARCGSSQCEVFGDSSHLSHDRSRSQRNLVARCNLRAISVPQRIRNGYHRATLVGLDNTAELGFLETTQVRNLPESISQAENAGSIPVTRSRFQVLECQLDGASGDPMFSLLCSLPRVRRPAPVDRCDERPHLVYLG